MSKASNGGDGGARIEAAIDPRYRRGVGLMLIGAGRRIFVGQRIDSPGDAWQMPQGGIDRDETPRQAAIRELREEVGTDKAEIIAESRGWYSYDLPPDLAGTLWRGRYIGQAQKWFALRFTGKDSDIDIASEHPEFSAWRWVAPDDLAGLIVPFKRRLYLDVIAEFRAVIETGAA